MKKIYLQSCLLYNFTLFVVAAGCATVGALSKTQCLLLNFCSWYGNCIKSVATYCIQCTSKVSFVNEKSVNFVLIKTMLRLWCWTSFPFTFSTFFSFMLKVSGKTHTNPTHTHRRILPMN